MDVNEELYNRMCELSDDKIRIHESVIEFTKKYEGMDLSDLDNYKWLQASLLSKGVNSILTAEIPLVKDAKAR